MCRFIFAVVLLLPLAARAELSGAIESGGPLAAASPDRPEIGDICLAVPVYDVEGYRGCLAHSGSLPPVLFPTVDDWLCPCLCEEALRMPHECAPQHHTMCFAEPQVDPDGAYFGCFTEVNGDVQFYPGMSWNSCRGFCTIY